MQMVANDTSAELGRVLLAEQARKSNSKNGSSCMWHLRGLQLDIASSGANQACMQSL